MSLVDSLLGAIIRLDGDCLVLHTGEKPYVVTSTSSMNAYRGPLSWGQVELSTRLLTTDAVVSMLEHFLTDEQRGILAELGAVENVLPANEDRPAFAVVAARGGDDIWVEIRPVKAAAPEVIDAPPEPIAEPAREPQPARQPQPARDREPMPAADEGPAPEVEVPYAAETERIEAVDEPQVAASFEVVPEVEQEHPDDEEVTQLLASSGLLETGATSIEVEEPEPPLEQMPLAAVEAPSDGLSSGEIALEEESSEDGSLEEIPLDRLAAAEAAPSAPGPALVVPLSRAVRQPEVAPAAASPPNVERLLRVAAARGASGLYLVAQSHPTVRVDGEMQQLDGEEPLSAADVEAFMLALAPDTTRDAVQSGEAAEWFREVDELGRVRCLSFRDHRGPGVIIRMLPARAISAEQLGLSKDIQALCAQSDGLVLVAGPRASGKSTLLAAFVDMVNRTRADHVITVERQITFVHDSRRSFVSQREVRGEAHEVLAAVRSALREDPDVLVVEELRSPEVVAAALEAAESGRLVLAGLRAPSSAQAVERLVSQVPVDRRAEALTALSLSLRGVVSQVLLRKRGGGRIAARELLLNTPAAASVIAEGKLFQLPAALESGRKVGSVALNDTLAALIRDGIVDAGEAWRKASDRDGLLALLKREGVDTSFVERLA